MKRKISYIVLLGEFAMIIVLHVAKYRKEQANEMSTRKTNSEMVKSTDSVQKNIFFAKYN